MSQYSEVTGFACKLQERVMIRKKLMLVR